MFCISMSGVIQYVLPSGMPQECPPGISLLSTPGGWVRKISWQNSAQTPADFHSWKVFPTVSWTTLTTLPYILTMFQYVFFHMFSVYGMFFSVFKYCSVCLLHFYVSGMFFICFDMFLICCCMFWYVFSYVSICSGMFPHMFFICFPISYHMFWYVFSYVFIMLICFSYVIVCFGMFSHIFYKFFICFLYLLYVLISFHMFLVSFPSLIISFLNIIISSHISPLFILVYYFTTNYLFITNLLSYI